MAGSAWSNQVTVLVIIQSGGNFQGLFIYSPTVGAGNLAGSWAASAGTDPYGNAYPRGLQIGKASDTAQALIAPSGSGAAAQLQFPIPAPVLSNTPNIAGGTVGGTYASMVISGPALATAGQKDWVQIIGYSNDSVSVAARMEFRYVDTNGVVTIVGSYNNTGFSCNQDLHFDAAPGTIGWFHGTQQFLLPAGGGPFISGESFHTLGNPAGITGTCRIKKLPWNAIWLEGEVTWSGTAGTTLTFGAPPDSTYSPTAALHRPVGSTGVPSTLQAPGRLFIPTAGGGPQLITPTVTAANTAWGWSVIYPNN